MKYEKIGKGFKIQTPDGYAIADSYNGSIICFTEHIIDAETCEVYEVEVHQDNGDLVCILEA